MSEDVLSVYLADTHVGALTRVSGRISFRYDDTYRLLTDPTPLSLSMPLSTAEHPYEVVAPWLTNLLSDHPVVRERLAHKFGLARARTWDLLVELGSDLPGAVRVLPPDADPAREAVFTPWSEARIAQEIRALHRDEAWVDPDLSRGRWSLAGAQGKFALTRTSEGWAEPTGAAPSTHIVKVGVHRLALSDVAEFVTMRAARSVGVATAPCELLTFEDQPAVVVTRYDRMATQGSIQRIHQEDLCQVLGVAPEMKYQSDGGPRWADCVHAVDTFVTGDFKTQARTQLLRWQVFNLLTASTDGHAKNLSMLLTRGAVALAPAYDLISIALLSEPAEVIHKAKLAMTFGKSYDVRAWTDHRIVRTAEESRFTPKQIAAEIARQSALLDGAMTQAMDTAASMVPTLDLTPMRTRWSHRAQTITNNLP